ncbi:hypothetical protein LNTAR_07799 [Lentisphaera araneosa HTCC2155]|uniref:Cytochrome c domain-containing protein n=1 Tax=Lentisphaera araneosa HTCC2155 TaxID=313628 RepID=A6DR41_9BACT|nr:DUF1588 domain-containing protein [Lentisphaera araneosa]EDM25929.1 hypothetical protein LNTAR_07799 [Lentisphaera araneosa HTCC2155]
MSEENMPQGDEPVVKMTEEDKDLLQIKLAELEILEEKVANGELSAENAEGLMTEVLDELNTIEQRVLAQNAADNPLEQPIEEAAPVSESASADSWPAIENLQVISSQTPAQETQSSSDDNSLDGLKVVKSSQKLKPWGDKVKKEQADVKITLNEDLDKAEAKKVDAEVQAEKVEHTEAREVKLDKPAAKEKSLGKTKSKIKTNTQGKRKSSKPGLKKKKLKVPTKLPKAQKKKKVPVGLIVFLAILGAIGYNYKPIIEYVQKQRAEIAERNKPKPVVKKEKPKYKPKPKPKVVEVEPEYEPEPEPVEVVENIFTGELKHYSFNQVLKDKCVTCHGEKGKEIEGDFNIVALMNSKSLNTRAWAKVYRSINKGEMPPEDDLNAKMLEEEEKELVLSSIKTLHEGLKVTDNTRVLTPFEIQNTMVDLFDIDTGTYNPFDSLHTAYSDKEFYTHQRKVLSPYYLAQYYHIMYDVLKSFVGLKPQIEKLNLKPTLSRNVHTSVNGKNYLDLRWNWQNRIDLVTYKHLDEKKVTAKQARKVGADENKAVESIMLKNSLPPGTYTLRFHGEALNMDLAKISEKKYGENVVDIFKEWKDRIGENALGLPVKFFIAPPGLGDAYASTQYLETIEIASSGEYALEFTLKRRAAIGFTLDVDYPNHSSLSTEIAYFKYGEEADQKAKEEMDAKYMRTIKYDFPMVRMKQVKIEGPYNVQVHPLSFDEEQRKKHIGTSQVGDKFKTLHKLLGLKNNIIYQYMFKDFQVDKLVYEDAYRNSLMMFFLSPQFLVVDNKPKTLEEFVRFSSYALLKSPPNEEFKNLYSQAKKSRKPQILSDYVRKHHNFRRFIAPFTYQWLKLGEIKTNLPDEEAFSTYYAKNFEDAYRVEAELFVEKLLKENRPIKELVTADYKIVNSDLDDFYNGVGWAKLRGRDQPPIVYEADFAVKKVNDANRGGILGMGAFLTTTGNGVDPLPLRRAAWISENILDSPLPTPPDVDVEAFEAGHNVKSLRERLAVHAENPACNSCHKRIDSLAIIMDRFDTIGGDNNHYSRDPVKINGEKIKDFVELKQYLAKYEKATARAFSKRLIEYMYGRETGVQDESKLDAILAECEPEGYRVGDLYTAVLRQYFL